MVKILAITPHEKWDCLATTVLEGLTKCDVELYCTDEGNEATNIISDEEFVAHYPTTDYILAFFSKMETPPPKYYLIDMVNGWHKTAYFDGSEYNYTGYNGRTDEKIHPLFREKARWYFMRDCLPGHIAQGFIPDLSCGGAVDADFGHYECEKDIDVLCAFGHTTTGLRAEAVRAVRELACEGYRVITSRVPDYLKYISRSWITIEAYGAGPVNARTWQIMANKSALFAQRYNVIIPGLIENCHYIGWASGEELKDKIRRWLAVKPALASLALDGYMNLLRYHTSAMRAIQVLRWISEGKISVRPI